MMRNHQWLIRDRNDVTALVTTIERACMAATPEAITAARDSDQPQILTMAGTTAEVRIQGPLLPTANRVARYFGITHTGYSEIRQALATAQADPSVSEIVLYIDSPGGSVAGLFDTLASIQATTKPMRVVGECACSAAYAIAAVAGRITANNAASEFGSIGVAVTYHEWTDVETIHITSTEAPNKRPNPKTSEGQAVIREVLDEVHDLFVGAIADGRTAASGRQFTADGINSGFGRGSTRLAAKALAAGMIDSISKSGVRSQHTAQAVKTKELGPMDLSTLKVQHPDTYAAAVAEGREAEAKRVKAHLRMAEIGPGARSVAFKAIQAGTSFTDEEVQAEYLSLRLTQRESDDIQEESDQAAAAVGGSTAGEQLDLGDLVADKLFGKVQA